MENLAWDKITQDLVVNGLLSLLTFMGNQAVNKARRFLEKNDVIHRAIKESIEPVLNQLDIRDEQIIDALRRYLLSPEVEAIVRQIYSAHLTKRLDSVKSSIRNEFLIGLALYLHEGEKNITTFANLLFELLIVECEKALQVAVSKKYLSLDQARTVLRDRMFHDELSAIEKNVDLLSSRKIDLESMKW